jgi:hypothetical protein
MAFLKREKHIEDRDRGVVAEGPVDDERPADRHRYKRGVTRGLFTVVGVAAALFLTWLAAESFQPSDGTSDFWIGMGLIAGGGLALGLSQLFGGWTKWGVPRISTGVLLFGWIPTAVVVGWILMTMQPSGGWQQSRLESWSDSIGVLGFVDNFAGYLAVPAIILGLVTAFIFDTAGPRTKLDTVARERRVPDEDVHDYRREETSTTTAHRDDEPVPAGSTVETRPTRRDAP